MRKKLIEVSLPLEAINVESAREKSIRHGHPSTLHLWWARRPLAACRAVLWASLVDDPSSWPDKFPTEEDQRKERERLFDILGRIEIEVDKKGNQKQIVRGLVSWDDIKDENIIHQAQKEIARCLAWERGEEPPKTPESVREYIAKYAPPAYDPFAGGGSIPLEAQRLGLEAHASDLNPVAVLINKALIEIPPKFKNLPPVNPEDRGERIEEREKREEEKGEKNALSRTDCMAKGDGSSKRTLSSGAETSERGNLRDAIADNQGSSFDSSEYSRGVDEGVEEGKSPVSSDRPGISGGNGDTDNLMRTDRMVSSTGNANVKEQTGRSESNADGNASKSQTRISSQKKNLSPLSSLLFPLPYTGAQGLAADVRFYGSWMREKALEKIGDLYPKIEIEERKEKREKRKEENSLSPLSSPLSPRSYTVIAWLWARTVKCPNPACGCQMPLVRSFELSTKKGKEAWVEYEIEERKEERGKRKEEREETKEDNSLSPLSSPLSPSVRFTVKTGKGKAPEGTVSRKGAVCVACGTPVGLDYVRSEGKAGRMGQQLMAIVAEGDKGRIYLSPTEEQEKVAFSAKPTWKPDSNLPKEALGFRVQNYGMTKHSDLFTNRQLVALTTFCDLVSEAKDRAIQDAISAGLPDDDVPLNDGGTGARAYGEAVATYLGMAVSKLADALTTLVRWKPSMDQAIATFGRQAIPMVWDYAESNIFNGAAGDYLTTLNNMLRVVQERNSLSSGIVSQHDATASHKNDEIPKLISTDPPYYDNIGYADLADFFYVWLRRSLGAIYPDICNTLLVPKSQELVATPYRFGGSKQKAQAFFEEGLGKTFQRLNTIANPNYPVTIYYAFKQAETEQKGKADESVASTGWETMLEGLIKANFSINGTWPMRSELSNRMVGQGTNALASSIVLVCRPRPKNAPKISRRQFLTEMQRELPKALKTLQQGNIAPVDLAQASIGPGMAIYSQYTAILENDGTALPVRNALQLINQLLDQFLTEQEGEFDPDTRWALTWFEQNQFNEGLYGDAETLSKAKNTSVQGLVTAGILEAKAGKVRLLQRHELKSDWHPETDSRTPDWEITQYLIHTLDKKGEIATAELLSQLGDKAEIARDLAYRLYNLCDRKGWTNEALAYNSLVIAWPEIQRLSNNLKSSPEQLGLL